MRDPRSFAVRWPGTLGRSLGPEATFMETLAAPGLEVLRLLLAALFLDLAPVARVVGERHRHRSIDLERQAIAFARVPARADDDLAAADAARGLAIVLLVGKAVVIDDLVPHVVF